MRLGRLRNCMDTPSAPWLGQEVGKPYRSSSSTRQRRHKPNALKLSVAQALGFFIPNCIAARIIEVPLGDGYLLTVNRTILRRGL